MKYFLKSKQTLKVLVINELTPPNLYNKEGFYLNFSATLFHKIDPPKGEALIVDAKRMSSRPAKDTLFMPSFEVISRLLVNLK